LKNILAKYRFITCVFLISIPAMSIAEPVEILLSGVLNADGTDSDNLDGSLIQVSYQADSTDTLATGDGGGPFFHTRTFGFNVSLDITSRPGGYEDLHGAWSDIGVRMLNNFTSSGENDGVRFYRAGGGDVLPEDVLFVDVWDIDFGTDSIFPDREDLPRSPYPPEDLSFFLTLDQDFTKYVISISDVYTSNNGLTFYSINNLTITNVYGVPETPLPDGDINDDGQVNAGDVLAALRIASGLMTASSEQMGHGDVAPLVNGSPAPDDVINAADVFVILRKALEQINF
jgi:hypothetical protein